MFVRQWQRRTARVVLLAFGTSLAGCGGAEETAAPSTTATAAPPTTLAPPTTVAPSSTLPAQPPEQLSTQELRELVAPVALYPDVVLASLLPATTYPEQVHEAAEWVAAQNGQVTGVPEDREWDGSVAGLLQFPDVLKWADDNDPWTEEMGEAMTWQQGDVLQAVQDFRHEAMAAGNLKSNDYMTVRQDEDQDVRIEPARADTVYVPQYDPGAVTEPQEKTGINPWLAFGGGVAVGALGAWALYSIFDDDDDDDDDDRRWRRRRRVRRYDDYYYHRGDRPQAVVWEPRRERPRERRRRRDRRAFETRPIERVYGTQASQRPSGMQAAGVPKPQVKPGVRDGGRRGGQQAERRAVPAVRPGGAPGGAPRGETLEPQAPKKKKKKQEKKKQREQQQRPQNGGGR